MVILNDPTCGFSRLEWGTGTCWRLREREREGEREGEREREGALLPRGSLILKYTEMPSRAGLKSV